MSAVLHVRCPYCPEVVDSVIESETWGSTIPGDHGCGNVTLHGSAMNAHIAENHTPADVLASLLSHYRSVRDNADDWIARFEIEVAKK